MRGIAQRIGGRERRVRREHRRAVRAADAARTGQRASRRVPSGVDVARDETPVARAVDRQRAARGHTGAGAARVDEEPAGAAERVGRVEVVVEVGEVEVRCVQRYAPFRRRQLTGERDARAADGDAAVARGERGRACVERHLRAGEVQPVERTLRDANAARHVRRGGGAGRVHVRVHLAVGITQRQPQRARERRQLRAVHVGGQVERGPRAADAAHVAAGRRVCAESEGGRAVQVHRSAGVARRSVAGIRSPAPARAVDQERDLGARRGRVAARVHVRHHGAAVDRDARTGERAERERARGRRQLGGTAGGQAALHGDDAARQRCFAGDGGRRTVGERGDRAVDRPPRGEAPVERTQRFERRVHPAGEAREAAVRGGAAVERTERRREPYASGERVQPARVDAAGELRIERSANRGQRRDVQAGQRRRGCLQQREAMGVDDARRRRARAVECGAHVERGAVGTLEVQRSHHAAAAAVDVKEPVQAPVTRVAVDDAAARELRTGSRDVHDAGELQAAQQLRDVGQPIAGAVQRDDDVRAHLALEFERAVRFGVDRTVARACVEDLQLATGDREGPGRRFERKAAIDELRRGERSAHDRCAQRPQRLEPERQPAAHGLTLRGGDRLLQLPEIARAGQREAHLRSGEVEDAAGDVQRHTGQRPFEAGRGQAVVVAGERSVRVSQRRGQTRDEHRAVRQACVQPEMRVRRPVRIDERVHASIDVAEIAVGDVHGMRGKREVDQRPDRKIGGGPALRLEATVRGERRLAVDGMQRATVVERKVNGVERVHVRRQHGVGGEPDDALTALVPRIRVPVDQLDGAVAHADPHVDRRRIGFRRGAAARQGHVVRAVGRVDERDDRALDIQRRDAEAPPCRAGQQVAQHVVQLDPACTEDGRAGAVRDGRVRRGRSAQPDLQARERDVIPGARHDGANHRRGDRIVECESRACKDEQRDHGGPGDRDESAHRRSYAQEGRRRNAHSPEC